ncbi:MAG: hypothetical protein PHF00_07765 [Elusimicrobia bacterium]|nr:hypothetical protein [Elusimicrobiota bacterium]
MPALRRESLLLALCLATPAAAAQIRPDAGEGFTLKMRQAAKQDPRFYTLDEGSVRLVRTSPMPRTKEGPADPTVIIDWLFNFAERFWSIIEKNRPVENIQTQYAAAVPVGITHWSQLEGWQPPKGDVYELSAKNAYGLRVVYVRYQVLRTWGGSYKGKGKYLTAVTVEPLSRSILWGYQLDLSVQIPDSSVVNVGTSEDPIAGMMPVLRWTITTPIKKSSGQAIYYLQGDGLLKEVGGPFSRGYQAGVAETLDKAIKSGFW